MCFNLVIGWGLISSLHYAVVFCFQHPLGAKIQNLQDVAALETNPVKKDEQVLFEM